MRRRSVSLSLAVVAVIAAALSSCSTVPDNPENVCDIFEERGRWYKAAANHYPVSECISGKGPCLPQNPVIHEGMITTGGVAQHTGASHDGFVIGSGLDDAQGRCSFIWSRDLCEATGFAVSAKIRGEFRDDRAMCNAGPINIRCGIASFQRNVDAWGGVDSVPETAKWQDELNPISSSMGYYFMTSFLQAEDTINYMAPEGRLVSSVPSLLDSQFFEIDITDQVNWILSHDGQFAIMFLVPAGQGNTGKINAYSSENCPGLDSILLGSDNPWTLDGNTVHIVVESKDLNMASVERQPKMFSSSSLIGPIYPNPFNPSTSITYNLGFNCPGAIQIFDIRGKIVFERPIQRSGTVMWNASNLGSGVYILKVLSAGKIYSHKLVLQR